MILQVRNVLKEFSLKSGKGSRTLKILDELELEMERGETIAVLGKSGSGKSTFLSLIAGLDQPTKGDILVNNVNIAAMSEKALAEFRASKIAMVFQQFHLLPHLTALENVSLPLELTQAAGDTSIEVAALEALKAVGLSDRAGHSPRELSGGEQQRVAIARAIVLKPDLLLADEPTGNLDSETNAEVTKQFFKIIKDHNLSLVLVTHDKSIADLCDKQYLLKNGKLELV